MSTLVLAPVPPSPARSGLPLRILHLARQLARAREVELVALSDGAGPAAEHPFALHLASREWDRRRMVRRWLWEPWPVAQVQSAAMSGFVRRGAWTTVQAHTLQMMRFGQAADAPLVFDAPD